jgi:hypothetical protein
VLCHFFNGNIRIAQHGPRQRKIGRPGPSLSPRCCRIEARFCPLPDDRAFELRQGNMKDQLSACPSSYRGSLEGIEKFIGSPPK